MPKDCPKSILAGLSPVMKRRIYLSNLKSAALTKQNVAHRHSHIIKVNLNLIRNIRLQKCTLNIEGGLLGAL